jgi:hypothetical protein
MREGTITNSLLAIRNRSEAFMNLISQQLSEYWNWLYDLSPLCPLLHPSSFVFHVEGHSAIWKIYFWNSPRALITNIFVACSILLGMLLNSSPSPANRDGKILTLWADPHSAKAQTTHSLHRARYSNSFGWMNWNSFSCRTNIPSLAGSPSGESKSLCSASRVLNGAILIKSVESCDSTDLHSLFQFLSVVFQWIDHLRKPMEDRIIRKSIVTTWLGDVNQFPFDRSSRLSLWANCGEMRWFHRRSTIKSFCFCGSDVEGF